MEVSESNPVIQELLMSQSFVVRSEQGEKFNEYYRTKDGEKKKNPVWQLEDIVHYMVKYPQFVKKFRKLYKANQDIANWIDKDGRTVRQVACKECRDVTLFMGRYYLENEPTYESTTCKIYKALDHSSVGEPKRIAMKFIIQKEHYMNEIQSRRDEHNNARFAAQFVTPDLDAYRADENQDYADACKAWKFEGTDANRFPDYCVTLEQGERSLQDEMNRDENLSARQKKFQRRAILLTLCKTYGYIHGMKYIHGDVKPHNVMRHAGADVQWKVIDFDACTKFGQLAGLKLTTGSIPPEMILKTGASQICIRQPGCGLDESDLLVADPSFDVWSYGILMYQLETGRSFFHGNLQGDLDQDGLKDLANLSQEGINRKLKLVEDVDARVLLWRILRLDPEERPTMADIEKDHYLNPDESPQGRKAEFFGKDILAPRPEEETGYESVPAFEEFVSEKSNFSFFKLRDEDNDWSDKLLFSEIETFHYKFDEMGQEPSLIDGDFIYNNKSLRDLLVLKGPDYFMGCLVEYFELYRIISDVHEVSQGIKANLISDVKSLKGIFAKLFVRGKGLNDIVRGTLFCNSIEQFHYVGGQLKESYKRNVYMKHPKKDVGAWPIPKLLVYGNRHIDGKCLSVEIQFSTVYLHLASKASNNHLVYESMREATGYLKGKGPDFQAFLNALNEKYIDTEDFLGNRRGGGGGRVGCFEILSRHAEHDGESPKVMMETKSTGFILSGLVQCRGRKFHFLAPKGPMQRFSASSFVVNKSLTLLSSHSYWSEKTCDLDGKSVEFLVSFQARGLVIAGIGSTECVHDSSAGERCSIHVSRSKLVIRKNGANMVVREHKLPDQEGAKLVFQVDDGTVFVSFVESSNGSSQQCDREEAFRVTLMSPREGYHLYMRSPAGFHNVKYHSVGVKDTVNWC